MPRVTEIANSGSVSHNGVTDDNDIATATNVIVASNITFTLSITNSGDADALNVVIKDTLLAGVEIVDNPDGGTISGNTITWDLGTVAANSGASVSVTVQTLHPSP